MEKIILKNAQIVTPTKIINGYLEIQNNEITKIVEGSTDQKGIDCKQNIIMPGFIEAHMHGGYGHDFESSSVEDFVDVAKKITAEGVTRFCMGNVTALIEDLEKMMGIYATVIEKYNTGAQARHIGAYMEGPFISPQYKGAHKIEWMTKPNIADFKKVLAASKNNIAYIVYAPELQEPGFAETLLANNVIPTMGHSAATFADVSQEVAKNVKHFTHMHNGMSPYHHRHPGMVNAGLYYDEILTEVITDGIHNDLDVIRELYKIKTADHLCIITDSMLAKGLPDGAYNIGPLPVQKKGMQVVLEDGTLAAAAATYIHNVKTFYQATNCSLFDLAKVTSANVAKELKLYDKTGSLEIGKLADLVILDKNNLDVQATYVEGLKAF